MDPSQSFSSDSTMVASKTFELLLDQIKSSNLNFQLQLSPFSAIISLKKTLVKDKFGSPLMPQTSSNSTEIAALTKKNLHLENVVKSLKSDFEISVIECEKSFKTIAKLEKELEEFRVRNVEIKKETFNQELLENTKHMESLSTYVKKIEKENETLLNHIDENKLVIADLEASTKTQKSISSRLNREMSETKANYQKEKVEATKNHKTEIKSGKRSLGQERKEKIRIERKLEALEKESEVKLNDENLPRNKSN